MPDRTVAYLKPLAAANAGEFSISNFAGFLGGGVGGHFDRQSDFAWTALGDTAAGDPPVIRKMASAPDGTLAACGEFRAEFSGWLPVPFLLMWNKRGGHIDVARAATSGMARCSTVGASDDGFIVGGRWSTQSNAASDELVALAGNGTLRTSWGTDGRLTLPAGISLVESVDPVQFDGSWYLAVNDVLSREAGILKVTPNGKRDVQFGRGGFLPVAHIGAVIDAVAVGSENLFVASTTSSGSNLKESVLACFGLRTRVIDGPARASGLVRLTMTPVAMSAPESLNRRLLVVGNLTRPLTRFGIRAGAISERFVF